MDPDPKPSSYGSGSGKSYGSLRIQFNNTGYNVNVIMITLSCFHIIVTMLHCYSGKLSYHVIIMITLSSYHDEIVISVADPDDFDADPDPTSEKNWIRILLYIKFCNKKVLLINGL
jgi:hypothetical protein